MKKPLQVLQVEDSESDAAMVVRLLSQAGYDVHHERVENAEEMQAALDRQSWDVIIADFALPQFDAPSALTLLQQTGLDIPFIVISGTVGEELAVTMMKAGAHDYLMKDKLLRLVPAVEREIREAQTRRKHWQAQAELQASELRFRALIEHSADVITTLTMDGIVLYASPAVSRVLGYQPDEIVGHSAFERLHPDHQTVAANVFGQILQQPGVPFSLETRFRDKDGAWRWIDATGINLLAEPSVQAIVVNYRDVTERKQAEAQLNTQLNELRRWHRATLGRETRILDLKREVNELLAQAGQPPRYPSAETDG